MTDRLPRIGVVTFPGSLDDADARRAVEAMGGEAVALWHADHDLGGVDAVVLPGGFSYGDYLRCGAIAARAPIMDEVRGFAGRGGPVLGICNGFQVLCEAGMLPGALDPQRVAPVRLRGRLAPRGNRADVRHARPHSGRARPDPGEARRGSVGGDARAARTCGGRRPRRVPVLRARRRVVRRGEPERGDEPHRGRAQRRRQRRRAHAAPRARGRSRRRTRPEDSRCSRRCSRRRSPGWGRDRTAPPAARPAATTSTTGSWRRSGASRTAPSSRCTR